MKYNTLLTAILLFIANLSLSAKKNVIKEYMNLKDGLVPIKHHLKDEHPNKDRILSFLKAFCDIKYAFYIDKEKKNFEIVHTDIFRKRKPYSKITLYKTKLYKIDISEMNQIEKYAFKSLVVEFQNAWEDYINELDLSDFNSEEKSLLKKVSGNFENLKESLS